MRFNLVQSALAVALLGLTACKNSTSISLDSSARKVKAVSSPFVQINQGGKALIVETGKTATTGVHGWATLTNVAAPTLSSASGNQIFLGRPVPPSH